MAYARHRLRGLGSVSIHRVPFHGLLSKPPWWQLASARLLCSSQGDGASRSGDDPPAAGQSQRTGAETDVEAARKELESLKEPEEPGPSECCGNSCNDCVWIEFWEAQEEYKRRRRALESKLAPQPAKHTE